VDKYSLETLAAFLEDERQLLPEEENYSERYFKYEQAADLLRGLSALRQALGNN
jgi:hypothetical protein